MADKNWLNELRVRLRAETAAAPRKGGGGTDPARVPWGLMPPPYRFNLPWHENEMLDRYTLIAV